MMFNFIQILYFHNVLSLPSFKEKTDDNIVNFLVTFKNSKTLKSWIELNKKNGDEIDCLKKVVRKISDIISEINTKNYSTLKSIILKSNIKSFFDIGEEYLETFIIINSIKRILMDHKKNEKKTTPHKKGYKSEKYEISDYGAFTEFSRIYKDINSAFFSVYQRASINKLSNYNFDYNTCSEVWQNAILPTNDNMIVYVLASLDGLTFSRKSFIDPVALYLENECTVLSLKSLLSKSGESIDYDGIILDIFEYMNVKFELNRSSTNLLISLIHFLSVLNSKDTFYELKKINENLYSVSWSASKTPTKENIKDYYLKKNIPASTKVKLIDGHWVIKDLNRFYSTVKPVNYKDTPMKARLMILSCGHQLGFSNIDEFFEFHYRGNDKESKCHRCEQIIRVLGSYYAEIYVTKIN